jgi:hypothetical protein
MLGTRNERSPQAVSKAWDIHSQGLAELVQLRGPEQFARKDGRDLFWVVFNTIVSSVRVQLSCNSSNWVLFFSSSKFEPS